MGIVGNRPETGLRITLRRTRDVDPGSSPAQVRARYQGEIVAPDGTSEQFFACVNDDETVSFEGTLDPAHAKRVTLLLRTIVRECAREGRAQLPTKIVRWWGEK